MGASPHCAHMLGTVDGYCEAVWTGFCRPCVNIIWTRLQCRHVNLTLRILTTIRDQYQDQLGRKGQDEPHIFCSNILPTGAVFRGSAWPGDRPGEGGGDSWCQGSLVAVQVQTYKFCGIFSSSVWICYLETGKGESVSEVEDSDNCCLIDVVQLSRFPNF